AQDPRNHLVANYVEIHLNMVPANARAVANSFFTLEKRPISIHHAATDAPSMPTWPDRFRPGTIRKRVRYTCLVGTICFFVHVFDKFSLFFRRHVRQFGIVLDFGFWILPAAMFARFEDRLVDR